MRAAIALTTSFFLGAGAVIQSRLPVRVERTATRL